MVPSLQKGNLYMKGKLRVWRVRKCILLVGAITPLTCARRQSTPPQSRRYSPEKGNLRILEWTYRYGTVFAPMQFLYQKEALGMECPEMHFPNRWKKTLLPVRADKVPRLKGGGIGLRRETCIYWGGPTAMVRGLHEGNIYIKRKLWVWSVRKCIFLVGGKNPLVCACRQSTQSEGRRCRAEKGNLCILGWTYRHGPVFAPRQYLYQKEATGMESRKMHFPRRCKNPTYLCGPSKYPSSRETV